MRYFYDLHIHTCLSPCGDDESTPNNVVNMAMLKGLDVIAIADHNSVLNCQACMEIGEAVGVLVIPAMELTTAEDIHVLCFFPTIDDAEQFNIHVDNVRMKVKNNKEIFGNQLIMNSDDEVIGKVDNLLILSSNIGIYDVVNLVSKYHGVAVPSHIDRDGSGVIPILGAIDEYMGFHSLEVSKRASIDYLASHSIGDEYYILHDSDAHSYVDILEKEDGALNSFSLEELTIENVLNKLK